jgi:hypothetical protein
MSFPTICPLDTTPKMVYTGSRVSVIHPYQSGVNMKSLAEYLGVEDPQVPDVPVSEAPSPKLSRKEFARAILATPEYRESLMYRIRLHELPPAVEVLLYHYAYGKPTDIVEVRENTNKLEQLSVDQLEERGMLLLERARQLRQHTVSDSSIH